MNDILFDQRIAAAFAALPPADTHLKARLLRLPEEQTQPAPRRFAPWRLLPAAAAVTAVVLLAVMLLSPGGPRPPALPLIPYEGLSGDGAVMGGMGVMGGVWSANAAELHRDSPACGREGELETMPVYRNPDFGEPQRLDEASAMEIAEKFGRAMGKTYTYVPPYWTAPGEQERVKAQVEEKLRAVGDTEEEIEKVLREQFFTQDSWEFQCGEETLNVTGHYGIRVSLNGPLPAGLPGGDGTAARCEAMCRQVLEPYASAIASLTGLRFSKASTALTGYNIYGEKGFETFFYVNNPGDPLAKQAEDYALKRLRVSVLEERDYVDVGYDREGNAVESISHQDAAFYLGFSLAYPGEGDLLGRYPVMDLENARRELLDGRCEGPSEVTIEMLSRATIEDAELAYSDSPRLRTWLPVYRFSVLFAPEDMEEPPRAMELGLRTYYDFYVPAVPAEYLVPQEEDGNMARLG